MNESWVFAGLGAMWWTLGGILSLLGRHRKLSSRRVKRPSAS